MIKIRQGLTLVEVMVVVLIVGFLYGGILMLLTNSDTYYKKGEAKIREQQDARLAMDTMVRELRESNTYWNVSIGSSSILFYKPVYNSAGYRTGITWMGFRLNPSDAHQLVKKSEGDTGYTPVANHIESVAFYGSTDGCASFASNTVPETCPRVRIVVTTKQEQNFTLVSDVTLRNQFVALPGEPPEEGEF